MENIKLCAANMKLHATCIAKVSDIRQKSRFRAVTLPCTPSSVGGLRGYI